MEPFSVVLLSGALILGAALVVSTALVVSPLRVEAWCSFDDGLHVSSALELRVGFGALALRRDLGGRSEIALFGLVLWRARRGRSWRRRLRDTLARREHRVRWSRRARWAARLLRVAGPRWLIIGRLLGRALEALRVRVSIGGTVGFDDPADTVVFFELLRLFTSRIPALTLSLDRDYFEEILELEVKVQALMWPPRFVGLALWALGQRELWPVLKAAWSRP